VYAYISGQLTFKCPTYVVLDAGGVGYHINISLNTYSVLADRTSCKLFTWLHVKEDAHTLYGFSDEGERKLFLHLVSVSGIGPNTVRMILSSITPVEIQDAIIRGDIPLIQKIKGIGPKSAQRMILELQDKLKKEGPGSLITIPHHHTAKDEALSALVMLGFAKNVAEKALDQALRGVKENLTVEKLIKTALNIL
jgi:Holliday junction DNA helicase RuvA